LERKSHDYTLLVRGRRRLHCVRCFQCPPPLSAGNRLHRRATSQRARRTPSPGRRTTTPLPDLERGIRTRWAAGARTSRRRRGGGARDRGVEPAHASGDFIAVVRQRGAHRARDGRLRAPSYTTALGCGVDIRFTRGKGRSGSRPSHSRSPRATRRTSCTCTRQ